MPDIPFDFKLNDKEIIIERFKSSGPGGQHANKTESAIRLTHVPTGLTASVQGDRSQQANMDKAYEILKTRVFLKELEDATRKTMDERKGQMGQGELGERIRTYNWPEDRVTDHRLNKTVHGLGKIYDGNLLEEYLDELIERDRSRQIDYMLREQFS